MILLQGVLGDRLLFNKAHTVVRAAGPAADETQLARKGKPLIWLVWVFVAIYVIGVLAAIIIPRFTRVSSNASRAELIAREVIPAVDEDTMDITTRGVENPTPQTPDPREPTIEEAKQLHRSDTYYARALRGLMPSFDTVAEVKRRFEGRSDADALAMGADLGKAGLARLSQEDHLALVRIHGRMLENVDEATCAALFLGPTSAQFLAAAGTLDSVSANRLVQIRLKAMTAEARQSPAPRPPPSEREVQDAWAALFRTMRRDGEAAAVQRVLQTAEDVDAASNGDLCWTFRTLIRRLDYLPPRAQQVMARRMIG
jgi:hypothetical protein